MNTHHQSPLKLGCWLLSVNNYFNPNVPDAAPAVVKQPEVGSFLEEVPQVGFGGE